MKCFLRTWMIGSLLLIISASIEKSGFAVAQTLQDAIKLSESEQFEKATSQFLSLIKKDPPNSDNYFFLGENYFKGEVIDSSFNAMDLDSANYYYQQGLKKNPENPLNYVGKGKVLWYEGKYEDAKKQFYDAIQIISPTNKSASFTPQQKALIYMKIAECYIKARTNNLPEANNLLGKALKTLGKKPEPDIYILQGDALLEQSGANASQAIALYRKASDMDKRSCRALLRIGQLYSRARNLPEAVKYYDEAIAVDPNFAPAYREKAEAFYRGRQYETAINNYQKYLELNSGSLGAKVRYASFLFLSKKYDMAIATIADIQKQTSSVLFLDRILGYSYYETGKFSEGKQAMEKFFAKIPDKKVISTDYEYYGKLLFKTGNDSLAVEELKHAIKRDSTKSELYLDLGKAYMKEKKYPAAIESFLKKTHGNTSEDPNDYYNLGLAYYYSQQCGKADTAFMRIVTLRPDITIGYLYRAKANSCLDPDSKQGLAKPFYEEFIAKVKPEDEEKSKSGVVEANEYLGYYYMLRKEYSKAKCCYSKIQSLDPTNIKAKKALGDPNLTRASCLQ